MLHVGQYFMSSFVTRAASNDFELPSTFFKMSLYRSVSNGKSDLHFNAAGAFLGLAVDNVLSHPNNGKPDTRTIVYRTFLAAPYIASADGFIEQKWSGTNQAGDNKDPIGMVIDAFTHHSLIDSNYTAVLVDLQGKPHMFLSTIILNHVEQECTVKQPMKLCCLTLKCIRELFT